MYTINKIFPTLLHTIDNIPISEELVQYCVTNPDLELGKSRSNRGGKQSPDTTEDSIVKDLIQNIIEENIHQVCQYELEIDNYWINLNTRHSYNVMHCHPGAILSGVVYIQASEDSGDLVFYHPNMYSIYQESAIYNREDLSQFINVRMKPKTGVCYIFPGHLMHLVEPNKTQDDRVSVSFNINVKNSKEP